MFATRWPSRLGQRVTIRHRLATGQPTDVVGTLVNVTQDTVEVDGPDGRVAIRLVDILADRVVPPKPVRVAPPHRALSIADLEAVTSLHWRPLEAAPLGDWLLRASAGFTNRANSALPLGSPGVDLPEALDAVRAWYADRGLPAKMTIADAQAGGPTEADPAPALREAALSAGWRIIAGASAHVLTAATAAAATSAANTPAARAGAYRVQIAEAPDSAWLARYHYRGQDLPDHAIRLLTSAPAQVFVCVRDPGLAGAVEDGVADSDVVAVARGSLGGGWGGLTAVEVLPSHRRRGLARLLLATVARWVGDHGARSLYLQVSDANTAARAMYLASGFSVHHGYDYWQAPQA